MLPRPAAVVAHLNQDLRRPSASEATDGLVVVVDDSSRGESEERDARRGCGGPAGSTFGRESSK
jgi:hypothetical protein